MSFRNGRFVHDDDAEIVTILSDQSVSLIREKNILKIVSSIFMLPFGIALTEVTPNKKKGTS